MWHHEHRETVAQRQRIEAENPTLAAKVAGARADAERGLVAPHIAKELGVPTEHDVAAWPPVHSLALERC